MARIHPSSVVEDGARIGDDVVIGPFCHVGPHTVIGDRVELKSHVVLAGHTELGEGVVIYPFASVGHAPQDLKYRGEPSRLTIGARTVIREQATLNPGTEGGGMLTSVGENCLIMACAHVGHDCRVGNNVILVNNATLGGMSRSAIMRFWAGFRQCTSGCASGHMRCLAACRALKMISFPMDRPWAIGHDLAASISWV